MYDFHVMLKWQYAKYERVSMNDIEGILTALLNSGKKVIEVWITQPGKQEVLRSHKL